jgi:ribonuclease R
VAGALRFELLSEGTVVPRRGRRDRGDGKPAPMGAATTAHPGRSPRKKDRKPGKHKSGKGKSKQGKSGKGKSGKGKSWTP